MEIACFSRILPRVDVSMAGHGLPKTLVLALLLMISSGSGLSRAQSGLGTLAGDLTDLQSKPLSGASVTVRNTATGAEARTTTGKNGSYRLRGLEPGTYTLEAERTGLGRGQVDGIVIAAGHEARVLVAVQLEDAESAPETARQVPPPAEAGPPKWFVQRASNANRMAMEPTAAQVRSVVPPETEHRMLLPARRIEETLKAHAALAAATPGAKGASELAVTHPETGARTGVEMGVEGMIAHGMNATHPASLARERGAALTEVASRAARATMQMIESQAEAIADGPAEAGAEQLTGSQIQSLPLPGRNWQNFMLDKPERGTETEGPSATSRGSKDPAAQEVDGAAIRLAFGGSGAGKMLGQGASLIGPGASEAAIREVQAAGGGDASMSRGAGARTDVETQRGRVGLHGQAFLFDRQNLWGAQNPFSQWVKETAAGAGSLTPAFTAQPYTPSDRETTWGAGLGGEIRRKKLFWFAAIDENGRNDPGVSTVKHPENFFAQPTNDELQVLSARLGLNSANPVAAGAAAYSGMLETLDGLLGPAARTSSQWTSFGRLDWALRERHRFTLEGTGALWNAPGGGLTRTTEAYGNRSYGSSGAGEQWLLGRWQAFATENLLVVTQASVGRYVATAQAETPSKYEQTLNINDWGQLPQMIVDSRYGFTIGNPSRFGPGDYPDEHLYHGGEQVSWVRGSVLLKAGFDAGRNMDATSLLRNQTGTYYYSSVENFASDALAFGEFGLNGQLNPMDQHNCDQTGKVWRDSGGTLHGLGYLPCYSYYSQTIGPSDWWLATSDWAGYATAQWEPKKKLAVSLAMRWDREQMPPAISKLNNPDLPLTQKLPSLGNEWGPRASLEWGSGESYWPVLRLGYGMYFGRTPNATLENALTQTGSLKGDLNLFMRPTDNLTEGGNPPFPYVLAGEPASVVKPGAVEFAPTFRNGEIHQAVVSAEESLPGHVRVEASAMASLGRRLPVTMDENVDPAVNPQTITYAVVDGNNSGPIKTRQITVPFFASWPSPEGSAGRLNSNYQQVTEIFARANSTYKAAMLRVTRYARNGLTLHARYTYAHAMDWNPNESAAVTGPSVFDPTDFREEYGTSNLDMRHSATAFAIWEPKWKLHELAGRMANGWMMSGVGYFRSGMPFTMRTAGSLAKEFGSTGAAIVALAPGMNGYGGDSRVYGVGRNTYRYPSAWKADLRLGKRFDLGNMRQLELLAESFNLFNHQNVTELETVGYSIEPGSVDGGLPSLNFLTGLRTGQTEFGQPLNVNATNFYRERQLQFGMRMRF